MKENKKNSSKDEGKLVTVNNKQITDSDLKLKYVKESVFAQISDEEIHKSDVWAMLINETDEMRSLATVIKNGEDAEITHMSCIDSWLKQDAFMKFYLFIERHYVNNGVKMMQVLIPKVERVTQIISFFKRAGFKKIGEAFGYIASKNKVFSSEEPVILLIKNDLEKWYEKIDGKYYPRIIKGDGVYKPVKEVLK